MWWNPNINICLSNTTGLHQGWKKVMQLEYGNWCRFAPSHCYTSSRQLQPNNLTVYKLRQCNPCAHVVQPKHQHVFVQYHWFARRLGEKRAIRIWECNAGSHHLTTLFLSRQFQPNNLPVYKLCETVPTQPMWSNPNINIACPILRVCIKVGRKSCS